MIDTSKLKHSFSSLKKHEQCPKADMHLNMLYDVRDYGSDASRYGTRCHKALELRVRDKTPLPSDLAWMESFCARLDGTPHTVYTERKLGLDRSLRACDWRKRWIGGILDLTVIGGKVAWTSDYKTGNPTYADDDQLKLCAAFVFAHHPEIEAVKGSFIWLKTRGIDTPVEFTRPDIKAWWKSFLPKIARRVAAAKSNTFPARPSKLCDWCAVKKAGKCKVG